MNMQRRWILGCCAAMLCWGGALGNGNRAVAFEYRLNANGTNSLAIPSDSVFAEEMLLMGYDIRNAGRAERDLWLLGASALLQSGDAQQDVRIFAGSAIVDGPTAQNLVVCAQAAQITTNATIGGELLMWGKTLVSEGTVAGDAWFIGTSVTLGGTYAGNVRIFADEIQLAPDTQIAGNLTYTSSSVLAPPTSVRIGGKLRQVNPVATPGGWEAFHGRLSWLGILFLGALLVGMPFVGFFPMVAGAAVRSLRQSPWRTFFTGLGMLFLAPFVLVFLGMTGIGLPLALTAGALYVVTLYLSHIVVALWLGHALLGRKNPQTLARVFRAMGTGLFLLYFLCAFPGVMSFLVLPVLVLGLGSLWRSLFHPIVLTRVPPRLRRPMPIPPSSFSNPEEPPSSDGDSTPPPQPPPTRRPPPNGSDEP